MHKVGRKEIRKGGKIDSKEYKVNVPNSVTYLIIHLYLSGVWLNVAPRTHTVRHVFKRD